jgi:hypothetical protein
MRHAAQAADVPSRCNHTGPHRLPKSGIVLACRNSADRSNSQSTIRSRLVSALSQQLDMFAGRQQHKRYAAIQLCSLRPLPLASAACQGPFALSGASSRVVARPLRHVGGVRYDGRPRVAPSNLPLRSMYACGWRHGVNRRLVVRKR